MVAIYIPDNGHNVPSRWYTLDDLANLLKENRYDPEAIHFIADMIHDGLGSLIEE